MTSDFTMFSIHLPYKGYQIPQMKLIISALYMKRYIDGDFIDSKSGTKKVKLVYI